MANHSHMLALAHYPQVQNHIENDPTPKDQAVFIPAVTPSYATDVYARNWARPLPANLPDNALNFLDPTNKEFFSISHVLSSAGQALNQKKPCIITQRDRSATTLLCDSGGYQIASGRLRINGDHDRMKILRWMELHGDYAMTLDVPTGPILRGDPTYPFKTTPECLTATIDHLTFFERNRREGDVELLNVLQGNTQLEADAWYDAVKGFRFEGWAFAGKLRNNMYELCRRIIIMANEGQLDGKSWIHVLGTAEIETAVLLTALQRAINKEINSDLRISFDAASPFRMLAYGQAYTVPSFSNSAMSMPSRKSPDDVALIGTEHQWLWPSAVGDKITMGDMCVKPNWKANGTYDTLSRNMLAHHNLSTLCYGIATANRVFDVESVINKHSFVPHVGAASEAIARVIRVGTLHELARMRHILCASTASSVFDTGEEDRMQLDA